MNVALPEDLSERIASYCARLGCSQESGILDLLRRGLVEVDLTDVRRDVQDLGAMTIDLSATHDALAPYVIATLALLAHRQAASASATLSETEYQELALDTARLIWDAVLAGRGVPIPERPASERP